MKRRKKKAIIDSEITPEKIRKLRESFGMTQGEFADKLGVSRRTAQGWEAETNPHLPSKLAMKALLALQIRQSVL